jgi:hypothetical protein
MFVFISFQSVEQVGVFYNSPWLYHTN